MRHDLSDSDNAERGRVLPESSVVDANQYRELIERPWRWTDGGICVPCCWSG